jgi:polyisoprenyl-phosphate glycosyltransferase
MTDSQREMRMASRELLSVVVPAYNEQEVLPEFHRRVCESLSPLSIRTEIVYVNDGSTDGTLKVIQDLRCGDERIGIVDLSRNFGKEIALAAGIDCAKGDAIVVIDADLQDPPELISEFVKYWKDGYDVVYGKRISRAGETLIKKFTAHAFYRLANRIGEIKIPEDTGDFRLLSRRAADSLMELRERHRFMKGLFTWVGYSQMEVTYKRDPRYAGKTKWNYWQLWNFALEGITSFTTAPLKVATYLGFIVALVAFVYAAIIIYRTLLYGNPVRGYPSLMVVILFLGGIQISAMGILGEYLGRVFDETKCRPLYFLKGYLPSKESRQSPHDE